MSRSSNIVIEAPMSFSGSLQRLNNWFWTDKPAWLKLMVSWWAMPTLLFIWWSAIVPWYLIFGLWLIPYRSARQDQRKRRKEDLQREEHYAQYRTLTKDID